MIGLAVALLLAAPAQSPSAAPRAESKSCRDMILSSSRLGVTKVCKTRAGWRRYDACHSSVTRYCSPKKRAAESAALKADSRALASVARHPASLKVVCKTVRQTGTRVGYDHRVCMPKVEWDRMSEDANGTANKEVGSFSKQPNRGCAASGCW